MADRAIGDPRRVLALMRAGCGEDAELVVATGPGGGFHEAYVGLRRVSENAWMRLLLSMEIRCIEGDGLRVGLTRYEVPRG